MNLVLVSGLACGLIGGVVMFSSHWSIYRTATQIVAGYPKVLAKLHAKRHDGRFGLGLLAAGFLMQAVAAAGYAAPMDLWRYPASAIIAAVLVYCGWRILEARRLIAPRSSGPSAAHAARGPYETRRTFRLREAARQESASIAAIERRRAPHDTGVVYLTRECDQRWWSEKFGVSVDVLKAAVRYAGPMVADVERHLAGSGKSRASIAKGIAVPIAAFA